jgi:glucokinase
MPNVDTDPDEVLPAIVAESRRLAAEAGIKISDIAAFGISAPFPADAAKGIMTRPTNNRKWKNVPILDYLKNQLGIDGCFENDANCAMLAEYFFGAAKNCRNAIYLTMSTGIGGGIITNGQLVRGGASLSAGELGHICIERNGRLCNCGMRGCYEAYCGGRALANRMREELSDKPESMIMQIAGGDPQKIDMRTLEAAVRAGDRYALDLWDEMSLRNAQGIGVFINTFNPEKIILGTLAWAVGDLYTKPLLKYLPEFCWPQLLKDCEIVCSELKREISSYAGIAAALNFINEKTASNAC